MKNILKNIKLCGAIVALGLLLPSCSDFLEEDPKDRIAVSNYYTTAEAAVSAVNAVYAHLNGQSGDTFAGVYFGGTWVAPGLASDEMTNLQAGAPDQDQLSTFSWNPENGMLYEVWKQHYKAITLANIAIARIPSIDMNVTTRDRLVNEARYLRGLLYFNMVRMFGSIPLLLDEVEPATPGASSVDDIYTQIIADLQAAENLPWEQAEGRGKATAGAAKALLAKVYLTRGNYDGAAQKCEEVIASNQYELFENFADIFKIANRGLKEAVFSVGFGTNNGKIIFWEISQMHVRLLPPELTAAGVTSNTLGWTGPTQELAESYLPQDERRDATVFNAFNETVNGVEYNVPFSRYYFRKYWDVTDPEELTTSTTADNDFPVIRFADVLLMYAEALNELGDSDGAHDALNEVRLRAGLAELSGLEKEAFRDALLEERKLEFAAEGHRWFDLVRFGKLEEAVSAAKPGVAPQSKHYLFPIPQRERDLNSNLPQNEF